MSIWSGPRLYWKPRREFESIDTEDSFLQKAKNKPFWLWGSKYHETWKYCTNCNERFPENTTHCPYCVNKDWEKNKEHNIKMQIWPIQTLKFNDELILNDIVTQEQPQECCFNHMIGCPQKDFQLEISPGNVIRETEILPIFNWQEKLWRELEKEQDNLILKAGGIGGSEFKLRQIGHHICSLRDYYNTQVPIVVGPERGLAQIMIKRFKDLFPFQIQNDKNTCELNNTWLHVFAAKNIGSTRSLKNPRDVILEEFDYFPVNDMRNVLETVFRYLVKSGAKVTAITTPNQPFGYAYTLEENPGTMHIIKLHYEVALGTIFSLMMIELQRLKFGFEREFCLMYGGTTGNYFNPADIDATVDEYELIPHKETTNIMGIDSGWKTSYFAIMIMSFIAGKLYVMYVNRWKRPHPDFMVNTVASLKRDWFVYKILTDGSDPQFIYRLKDRFKDSVPIQYAKNPDNAYDYHFVPKELYLDMKVIPTFFTQKVMDFLHQDDLLLRNKNRILRIHKSFYPIVNRALHQVYVEKGQYKKENSDLNDVVDTFSECVNYLTIKSMLKVRTI